MSRIVSVQWSDINIGKMMMEKTELKMALSASESLIMWHDLHSVCELICYAKHTKCRDQDFCNAEFNEWNRWKWKTLSSSHWKSLKEEAKMAICTMHEIGTPCSIYRLWYIFSLSFSLFSYPVDVCARPQPLCYMIAGAQKDSENFIAVAEY